MEDQSSIISNGGEKQEKRGGRTLESQEKRTEDPETEGGGIFISPAEPVLLWQSELKMTKVKPQKYF